MRDYVISTSNSGGGGGGVAAVSASASALCQPELKSIHMKPHAFLPIQLFMPFFFRIESFALAVRVPQ